MPAHFRRAKPGDAPALSALARCAKAHWGYPDEWLASWSAELTLTPEYLTAQQVLVAELDGQIVGVCALEDHRTHWALEHVWVLPTAHGQGVGRELVHRSLNAAATRRGGTVRVTSDPHASAFYERLGARRAGAVVAPMPGAGDRTLPVYEFCV